jgi:hypothetical protein
MPIFADCELGALDHSLAVQHQSQPDGGMTCADAASASVEAWARSIVRCSKAT